MVYVYDVNVFNVVGVMWYKNINVVYCKKLISASGAYVFFVRVVYDAYDCDFILCLFFFFELIFCDILFLFMFINVIVIVMSI